MASSIDERDTRASAHRPPTATLPARNLHSHAQRSRRVARWTANTPAVYKVRTPRTPPPNPTTLHRSEPPAESSFTALPAAPLMELAVTVELTKASPILPQYSHRPRDRRLDEVDDALMRGRFGRLRATAISSAPLLPSLCITLGAASASVSFSDTRAHLARDQLTNLWRCRRLFICHDQHVPCPRKVLKLNLLKPQPLKRGTSS